MNRSIVVGALVVALLLPVSFAVTFYLLPWQMLDQGALTLSPRHTITVTGTAKMEQKTQIAQYSAGVMITSDDKDKATKDAATQIDELITKLVEFGVDRADIKTEYVNVYQNQDSVYEEGRQRLKPGQWQVNHSISLKLRDAEKAEELSQVLVASGATNINGPSFTFEDAQSLENSLSAEALQDAQTKAEQMASSIGRNVGKVVTISENSYLPGVIPMFDRMQGGGGGGGAYQPNTDTIQKTITVTYELK